MFQRPLLVAVAALSLAVTSSQAITIVDTGTPGTFPSTHWARHDLAAYQWLGFEFSVGQATTVTDIQGWIGVSGAGSLRITLYGDGGERPGAQMFTTTFNVASPAPNVNPSQWRGVSGLNWLVGPGSYWAAFEVRPTETFHGWMEAPSPAPLGNEAVRGSWNLQWTEVDYLDLGVRVLGDVWTPPSGPTANVPEGGSTVALMGLAIAGLGACRQWFRRSAGTR
jgi:hypothetical protein